MKAEAITLLFKEASIAFSPINGKPTDDDLLAIQEVLLPILMLIPYNQLTAVHSLTRLITKTVQYSADHGNLAFPRPSRLPLYNLTIANDATTVILVWAEAAHQAKPDEYKRYKAAERGIHAFLLAAIQDTWYNDLKDANTHQKPAYGCCSHK